MYLNIWGAEEIYEQSQQEQQEQPAQKDNEKDKSLYSYLQSLLPGNSKKEKECRQS